MAAKKQQKEFQTYITESKKWEEELKNATKSKSLLVVDVHSTWCGNCKAIVPTFQRLHLEKSDQYPIKFFVVDAEKVVPPVTKSDDDFLTAYTEKPKEEEWKTVLRECAGKSQPHFLFYVNGQLKKKIVGVNTPLILKVTKTCLEELDMTLEEGTVIELDDEGNRILKKKEKQFSVDDLAKELIQKWIQQSITQLQ